MAAAVRGRPNLAVPAGRVRPRAEAVDAPSDPLRVSGGVALSLAGAELLPRRAEIDAGPRRSAGLFWQWQRGGLGAGVREGGRGLGPFGGGKRPGGNFRPARPSPPPGLPLPPPC